METIVTRQTRATRREPEILHLLDEIAESNICVKDVCKTHCISAVTLYNWWNQYETRAVEQAA